MLALTSNAIALLSFMSFGTVISWIFGLLLTKKREIFKQKIKIMSSITRSLVF